MINTPRKEFIKARPQGFSKTKESISIKLCSSSPILKMGGKIKKSF